VYRDGEALRLIVFLICRSKYFYSVFFFFFQGDSGGPVMNKEGHLVGLVSWGKATDPLGYPKVFADLESPRMRSFIETVLNHI